jgi:hypothetical protein
MFRVRAFSQNAKSTQVALLQISVAQTDTDAVHAYRSENGRRVDRVTNIYRRPVERFCWASPL